MTTITINGNSFNMYSYYLINLGITLRLENTTFGAIEVAAGDDATIQVGEEYVGYNLHLVSMQTIENTIQCIFENTDALSRLEALETQILNHASQLASQQTQLSTQSEDLEANAVAIAELAEIVGGNE